MSAGPDADAALMLRVQQGDMEAFDALLTRYRQPVCNFVYRTLFDPDEAEDLAQQVFLQAWKAARRYRPTSRFSTWLFTIARNLCLNELRRRSRHPTESFDAPHADASFERDVPDQRAPGTLEGVLLDELDARIAEGLRDLPESQRSALLLFRDQELAYDEIARVLGVSVSATKSLIHRARETLKRRLKPYLRSGEWEPSGVPPATFHEPRV